MSTREMFEDCQQLKTPVYRSDSPEMVQYMTDADLTRELDEFIAQVDAGTLDDKLGVRLWREEALRDFRATKLRRAGVFWMTVSDEVDDC